MKESENIILTAKEPFGIDVLAAKKSIIDTINKLDGSAAVWNTNILLMKNSSGALQTMFQMGKFRRWLLLRRWKRESRGGSL